MRHLFERGERPRQEGQAETRVPYRVAQLADAVQAQRAPLAVAGFRAQGEREALVPECPAAPAERRVDEPQMPQGRGASVGVLQRVLEGERPLVALDGELVVTAVLVHTSDVVQ